jgi:hypothetical protein
MSDNRQLVTLERISSKYSANAPRCTESPQSTELECAERVRPEPLPSSGLERAMRWISPLVLVMLLGAGIGLYFQKQQSIHSGLGRIRERTAGPVDFALWLGGSDETLHEKFKNKIDEVKRQADAERAEMKAKMEKPIEFDPANFLYRQMMPDHQ